MKSRILLVAVFGVSLVMWFLIFRSGERVNAYSIRYEDITPTNMEVVSCEDAAKYPDLKMREDAYTKISQIQVGAKCALEGLATIQAQKALTPTATATPEPTFTPTTTATPTPDNYTAAGNLALSGYWDKADEALQSAINNDAGKSAPGGGYFIFRFLQNIMVAAIAVTLTILAAIKWSEWQKLHIDVAEFDINSEITTLDKNNKEAINGALISEFEKEFYELSGTDGFSRPDMIEKTLAELELPDFSSEAAKEVNTLLKAIQKIFPLNIITIKASLGKDDKKGLGITIRIIDAQNHYSGLHTIWEYDFNPDFRAVIEKPTIKDYTNLIMSAAVWSAWEIKKKSDKKFDFQKVFGTTSHESYIACRQATAIANEQEEQAITMFLRALRFDDQNTIALLNLGIHLWRKASNNKDLSEAKQYLQDAQTYLEQVANKGPLSISQISAKYNLGLIKIDQYLNSVGTLELLEQAQEILQKALEDAEMFNKTKAAKTRSITQDYIDVIRIPLEDVKWWKPGGKEPTEKKLNQLFAPRVLYNLACRYSMAVTLKLAPEKEKEYLDKSYAYLEKAITIRPNYLDNAKDDATLQDIRNYSKYLALVNKYQQENEQLTEFQELIGIECAKILKNAGIVNIVKFLEQTSEKGTRQHLAAHCAIDEQLLLAWAKLAEMKRIPGLNLEQIKLLNTLKISSIEQLAAANSQDLSEQITQGQKVGAKPLATIEQVSSWIEQAKRLTTIVEP